jgi:hypothetical protein
MVFIRLVAAYVVAPQGAISTTLSDMIDVLQDVTLATGILISLVVDTAYKDFTQLPVQ